LPAAIRLGVGGFFRTYLSGIIYLIGNGNGNGVGAKAGNVGTSARAIPAGEVEKKSSWRTVQATATLLSRRI